MGKQDSSRGKLSSIILSTLCDGDKYGFEIITEIEKQTNGAVVIKQPSLYSSLKRMEDQDLISSYWMDSEIGGRRHYYRLTDFGRKKLEQWKNEFDITNFQSPKMPPAPQPQPTFLQQENLFDLQNKDGDKQENPTPKPFEDDAVLLKNESFIQYNLFEQPTGVTQSNFDNISSPAVPHNQEKTTSVETNKAANEQKEEVEEKPYDIFAELDLFRNSNKSFAGSMSNSKPKEDFHSGTLKSFMGESFVMQNLDNSVFASSPASNFDDTKEVEQNINLEEISLPQSNNEKTTYSQFSQNVSELHAHERDEGTIPFERDEGTLITERFTDQELPKVKKIAPPSIDVFSSSKNSEIKRDTKPNSYDEKIGELRRKNNQNATADEVAPLTISNYTNLKKYFAEQKIPFRTHQKSDENKTTQTSLVSDYKFSFIRLGLTFFSLILSLVICFVCIKHLSHIPNAAIAVYVVPPALYLLYATFVIIEKSKNKDRKVLLMETSKVQLLIKIAICIVLSILIYVFNLIGGLNSSNFNDFTNTMIVPFVVVLHIPLTSLFSHITTKFKCIK